MSYDDWGVEDGGIKHDTDEFDKREKVENRALDITDHGTRKLSPSLFLPPVLSTPICSFLGFFLFNYHNL